jgi:hypothetical protein
MTAATTVVPRSTAFPIRRASNGSGGPPRLKFRICASPAMAKSSARASAQLLHTVSMAVGARCQHALAARISASGATPKIPMWLSASAAMTPATAVPCMSSPNVRSPPWTNVAVLTIRPSRSGCAVWTPVSTSAILTPLPVAQRWARSARIECAPYCRPAYGSV